MDLTNIN